MHTDSTGAPSIGRRAFLCLLAGGVTSLAFPAPLEAGKRPGPSRVALAQFPRVPTNIRPEELARANVQQLVFTISREDRQYGDRMRAAGWQGEALLYLRWSAVVGPPDHAPSDWQPYDNQAGWIKGDYESLPESAFLHGPAGERLYNLDGVKQDQRYYQMNPLDGGWRTLFATRTNEWIRDHGGLVNGFFWDNLDVVWSANRHHTYVPSCREYPDAATFRRATHQGMVEARARMTPAQPGRAWRARVWGNMIEAPTITGHEWDDTATHLDGCASEPSFRRYNGVWHLPEAIVLQWEQFARLLAQGTGVMVNVQGSNPKDLPYALALYRMIQQEPLSLFSFNDAGSYAVALVRHKELSRDLGMPLGPRQKSGGDTWTRRFQRGTVTVDLARRKVTIR